MWYWITDLGCDTGVLFGDGIGFGFGFGFGLPVWVPKFGFGLRVLVWVFRYGSGVEFRICVWVCVWVGGCRLTFVGGWEWVEGW